MIFRDMAKEKPKKRLINSKYPPLYTYFIMYYKKYFVTLHHL